MDWFDCLTLRRWLDDDRETLARLFSQRPARAVRQPCPSDRRALGPVGGSLADQTASVLARHAPDLVWRCLSEPAGKRHRDTHAVLGVVRGLPLLPPEFGRKLLAAIARDSRKTFPREWLSRAWFMHKCDASHAAAQDRIPPTELRPVFPKRTVLVGLQLDAAPHSLAAQHGKDCAAGAIDS